MKATRIAIILLGCFCIAAIAQADVEDSDDEVEVANTYEKDSKEKNSKEKNSKEKNSKEKNSKEKDSKEKNSEEKDDIKDNIEAANGCPKIISRKQWGAKPARGTIRPLQVFPPKHIFIHHTVTPACKTTAACSAQMRSIQDYHKNHQNWLDIGYSFLVGGDGNVYEGRGWNKEGAHTIGYNRKSLAISFIGTFTSGKPTKAAMDNARKLITCGIAKRQISKDYKLLGHRQVYATSCPGNALYVEIKKWPHYSAKP